MSATSAVSAVSNISADAQRNVARKSFTGEPSSAPEDDRYGWDTYDPQDKQIIYTQAVKSQNDRFIEQVKNNITFNLFGYIIPFLKQIITDKRGADATEITIDCYDLAYSIAVPEENDDSIDYDRAILLQMTTDIEPIPIPRIQTLYYCIAKKLGDFLYDIPFYPNGEINIRELKYIILLFNLVDVFLDSIEEVDVYYPLTKESRKGKNIKTNVINSCILNVLGYVDSKNGEDMKVSEYSDSEDMVKTGGMTEESSASSSADSPKSKYDAVMHAVYQSDFFTDIEGLINAVHRNNTEYDIKLQYEARYNELISTIASLIGKDHDIVFKKLYFPLNKRVTDNSVNRFREMIDKGIDALLKPLMTQIRDQEAKEKKDQKEQARKAKAEEKLAKAEEKKREREEKKASEESGLGELEPIRKQFIQAIAEIGLYLNGNFDTKVITTTNTTTNPFLINLLIAEQKALGFYAFKQKGGANLDDILIDVVKKQYPEDSWKGGKYLCYNSADVDSRKYIIDNAADGIKISTQLREKNVICSLTSILDGMSQCTIGSKGDYNATSIEYGNMDFMITNTATNSYYHGTLTIENNDTTRIPNFVSYNISYKTIHGNDLHTSIDNIVVKKGKIRDLEAHKVLKNALINVLRTIIPYVNNDVGDYLLQQTTGKYNLFKNIVNYVKGINLTINGLSTPKTIIVDQTIQDKLLQSIFTILGKGAGDIFQEINAVCKNGGYIGSPSYGSFSFITNKLESSTGTNTNTIIPWNSQGEAVRFFAANDRPSATRFIFLNQLGQRSQINTLSAGGYITSVVDVIAQRGNDNLCGQVKTASMTKIRKGGKKTIRRKKKYIKMGKTKKQNRMYSNKRSKKHIAMKKHSNTKRL